MNNKHHLLTERSIDRTPKSNEGSILNLFKEKIPINAASIIISRNIKTLFEAYRLLEQNNWTRFDNKHRNLKMFQVLTIQIKDTFTQVEIISNLTNIEGSQEI